MSEPIQDSPETDIATNLERIHARIAEAAQRSGRPAEDVTLLAVSKTFPAPVIREAIAAGQKHFGESKVQEATVKIPQLPGSGLHWHLIGHLQKNKIRKALPFFDCIETVDSLERARQIDRIAEEEGRFPKVNLQVNIAEDGAKHGFSPEAICRDLDPLLDLERLHIQGLMTIPAFTADPEEVRPDFAHLRELRDKLEDLGGIPLPGLSMGMSRDFEIAVEEGATLVRVGTGIFGKRTSVMQQQASRSPD